MSQPNSPSSTSDSLTGLLIPLSDRRLLVPNVAVAELISCRGLQRPSGMPSWFVGQLPWRDLQLPVLCFEAACGAPVPESLDNARVVVINALGGRPLVKFLAVLVQGIPRSLKIDDKLQRAEVPLDALELDAVRLGDEVARIPDLVALEQLLADLGVI